MFVHATALALLLAANVAVPPAVELTCSDPEITKWVEVLDSATASAEVLEAALTGLRAAAKGPPEEDRTRDALFALAWHLHRFDGAGPEEALEAMRKASIFYPDDPRATGALAMLAQSHLKAGDELSAHLTFARLLNRGDAPEQRELLALAAANAVKIGDSASALAWSSGIEIEALPADLRAQLLRARLKALSGIEREAEALAALDSLDSMEENGLRQDGDALLAAARIEAAAERNDSALKRYESFVNIHTGSPARPVAMLELGKLQARHGMTAAGGRTFDWIIGEYPQQPQGDIARVELVALDDSLSIEQRAAALRDAAETAGSATGAMAACMKIIEILIAADRPLDAISFLATTAREGEGLAAPAAVEALREGSETALTAILSRKNDLHVAAAAVTLGALGLPVPPPHEDEVDAARLRLGLTPLTADAEDPVPTAATLWREGRDDEALESIAEALQKDPSSKQRRRLLALRADILFASGKGDDACADYRSALELARTTWVSNQVERCHAPSGPGAEVKP
jgi:Tfp pilus assembly protein PilF